MAFDPFGDFSTRGYLRNVFAEKNPERIKSLEHGLFAENVGKAMADFQRLTQLRYDDVLATNKTLFGALYPWVGHDRATLAPNSAIGKAGHFDLFAHPRDVHRAVDHALDVARDHSAMRARPGEVFGLLAYAHPFLETNGRTLMTVHADLSRRAGFHIAWQDIGKTDFLNALTTELRQPGTALDHLLAAHIRPGPLPTHIDANDLGSNPGLNPAGADLPQRPRGTTPAI